MSQGTARYAEVNGTWFIILAGDVRYPLAPSLESLLKRALESANSRFVIDLREIEGIGIDSTCLGVLVKTADRQLSPHAPRPMIITCGDIDELLRVMRFDLLFDLVAINTLNVLPITMNLATKEEIERLYTKVQNELQPIPTIAISEEEMKQLLLKSHQRLCAIDAATNTIFKDVVTAMEADMQKIAA